MMSLSPLFPLYPAQKMVLMTLMKHGWIGRNGGKEGGRKKESKRTHSNLRVIIKRRKKRNS